MRLLARVYADGNTPSKASNNGPLLGTVGADRPTVVVEFYEAKVHGQVLVKQIPLAIHTKAPISLALEMFFLPRFGHVVAQSCPLHKIARSVFTDLFEHIYPWLACP
jgi:hypothetical protein